MLYRNWAVGGRAHTCTYTVLDCNVTCSFCNYVYMYIVIKITMTLTQGNGQTHPPLREGGTRKLNRSCHVRHWSIWARDPGEARHQLTASRNVTVTLTRCAVL